MELLSAGEARGGQYLGSDTYWTDKTGFPTLHLADLQSLASTAGQEMTFTCQPLGSGGRTGMNRDLDLLLDASDNCPAVPNDDQADPDENGIGDACEAVPEPTPPVLLAAGAAGLALLYRRRSRASGL